MFRSLLSSGSNWSFHLQVVEKNSLRCFKPEESSENLLVGAGGEVPCPGLNCSDNSDVIWYKVKYTHEQDNPFHSVSKTQTSVFFLQGIKAVSEQRRASCQQNGRLHLCRVSEHDTGIYFCDRQITEQGVKWTFRRSVNVTAVRKCCVCVCVYCH